MTTYTTYVNYGVKPWVFFVENYGVPPPRAAQLFTWALKQTQLQGVIGRERGYRLAKLLLKRVRALGYIKLPEKE